MENDKTVNSIKRSKQNFILHNKEHRTFGNSIIGQLLYRYGISASVEQLIDRTDDALYFQVPHEMKSRFDWYCVINLPQLIVCLSDSGGEKLINFSASIDSHKCVRCMWSFCRRGSSYVQLLVDKQTTKYTWNHFVHLVSTGQANFVVNSLMMLLEVRHFFAYKSALNRSNTIV